jgi:hypothetical protein
LLSNLGDPAEGGVQDEVQYIAEHVRARIIV